VYVVGIHTHVHNLLAPQRAGLVRESLPPPSDPNIIMKYIVWLEEDVISTMTKE